MSYTPNFNLFKPDNTDGFNIADFNGNADKIDTEMRRPPLTVNGNTPDTSRNIFIKEVPLATNLSSDIAQYVAGTFIQRTTGGGTPVSNGEASLTSIKGNMVHEGVVAESIDMTVTGEAITATLDRDTFVSYVSSSGTITLVYTSSWSADPANYGITVSGTPTDGDTITVVYVKEDRGTIYTATPSAFNSTGWNLYDKTTGIAKVVDYSTQYGYLVGGSYTLLEFATTISGTRSVVDVNNGHFSVPSDGYIFVTGGDATTYILATWSDWTDGYSGNFQSYTVDTIDLSEIMVDFPYGLLAVGGVRDEINIAAQLAIHRVQRLDYADNIEDVIASGLAYEADTNYVYVVLATPTTESIELDGDYIVSDHGIEFYDGTDVPVVSESLYGENLKDKLRTDVLTISAQTLTATQKAQVISNIGAVGVNTLDGVSFLKFSIQANASLTLTLSNTYRGLLICGSTANNDNGLVALRTTSGGVPVAQTLVGASTQTFNVSTNNKVTITAPNYGSYCLITYSGTASK